MRKLPARLVYVVVLLKTENTQVIRKINETLSDSGSSRFRRKRVSETVTATVFITRIILFLTTIQTNLYSSSISTLSTQITQTVVSTTLTTTQISSISSSRNSIQTQTSSFTSAKSALQVWFTTNPSH